MTMPYYQLTEFNITRTGATYDITYGNPDTDTFFVATISMNVDSGRAKSQAIELPNGLIFDPNGLYKAAIVPGTLTARLYSKQISSIALLNNYKFYTGLVAERGRIAIAPRDDMSGGDRYIATARLVNVSTELNAPYNINRKWLIFTMTFDLLTTWAQG